MNILALDTAGPVLSVALAAGGGRWHAEVEAGARHAELLMELVDSLCRLAGISPGDLDLAACMRGPGSFTGLRIGYATAKGLTLARGIPLTTVPALDCLARPFPGLVLPVMDAKQGRFFAALYRDGARLTGDGAVSPEALAALVAERRLPGETAFLTGPAADLLFPRLLPLAGASPLALDPRPRRGRALELLDLARPEAAADPFAAPEYLAEPSVVV